jgi:hypothetical protein
VKNTGAASQQNHLVESLSSAKSLADAKDYNAAAQVYSDLLKTDLPQVLRGEVLTNLAAALCFASHGANGEVALINLDQARECLLEALNYRSRQKMPAAWAVSRANLALVYLARHETAGRDEDMLSAHLALDGTEEALHEAGDAALQDWAKAIRDHLLELRDRRSERR